MKSFLTVLVWTFTLLCPFPSSAAPESKLWVFWANHDPKSLTSIDHLNWQTFLDAYVVTSSDGINRITYRKANQAGRP